MNSCNWLKTLLSSLILMGYYHTTCLLFFNDSSFVTIAGDRVLVIAENVVGWEGFLSIDEIWIWVQTFT